ncbi:alpha/beta hydrolase [Reyranella sp. CPCC 100927]|uniref:alpha/beta hydrolase n=1 Tax=Reyranella sp. CPCC 100927 TaxID=2599616 RepID=UPI0015B7681B|nr:alpha/beta hydrolase [Reyranella sp. CPCC 100927]
MTLIYRDFDQAGLDAAYNNRLAVPDFEAAYVGRWMALSADARARVPCRLNLTYGPSPRQRLDVFMPPGTAPSGGRPALLYIHGGYWQGGDKDIYSFLASGVTDKGALFIAATYDLCPTVTMSALVEQTRQVVDWVHARAGEIGLDPGRLVVAGHSAGGHIAATLAHTDWAARGLPANALAGALPLSGLYDLEPIRLNYLNAACRMDAAEAARLSPIRHIGRTAPPTVLAVGAAELPELVRQTRDYGAALTRAGVPPRAIVETSGDNHFSIVDTLLDPGSALWPHLKSLMKL